VSACDSLKYFEEGMVASACIMQGGSKSVIILDFTNPLERTILPTGLSHPNIFLDVGSSLLPPIYLLIVFYLFVFDIIISE
jgi:hypothetical protein